MTTLNNTMNSFDLNNVATYPSFMTQTQAHPSRSSRYTVVPTGDLVKKLQDAGFILKSIRNRKARKNDGFQAHQLVFEHPEVKLAYDDLNRELRPQIYISNSYDGTTRFMIGGGFFRFVCENGLIAGDIFASMTQKHIGIDTDDVLNILDHLIYMFKGPMTQYIHFLKTTEISAEQSLELARRALELRFSTEGRFVGGEYHKLLVVRRPEDSENTLWSVLNRIQENLGLNYRKEETIMYQIDAVDKKTGQSKIVGKQMKRLRDFKRVTELNRSLFNMVDEYLPSELKEQINIAA